MEISLYDVQLSALSTRKTIQQGRKARGHHFRATYFRGSSYSLQILVLHEAISNFVWQYTNLA